MTDFAELVLGVNSRGLTDGKAALRDFEAQGGKTEAAMDRTASAIGKSWSKMAAGVGVALAAVFSGGAVIRGIAEFETSMSKVAAISGATNRELEDLRKTAQKLGSTTEFSAGQAADALGFLSMAGFEASESMAAIPAVLDLATASGLDLANAADIASNVLSGFGKSADEAASVADVLAEAASASNTSVAQLGSAMSTVAPISAALGVSMEETAAAIGTMSDAGIQGERAGTALRGVMAALASPTDAAAGALASYGLSVADVNPETQSLTDIMGELAERGISTADAMTIFGREAASGALVIANASDSMGELTRQFEQADGAASDMAGTMRDNLGGDINGLRSATEGLILALGEAGLTTIIRTLVQVVTGFVRGISGMVSAISTATGAISNFVRSKVLASTAIDNTTLAIGDEIRQANALFALMGQGNTMTQSAALAKLSEAEAHLRNAEALQAETQAMVDLQLAALELQRITSEDALRSIAAPGTDLLEIAAHMRDSYEETEQTLARIVADQASLRDLASSTGGNLAEARGEVERIRSAIENAVDGMVTFDGEVITANELSERLSKTIKSITFSSAISSAALLANDLGVNIKLAERLNATLNKTAGIQAAAAQPKFSHNISGELIPNDVSNANLTFGNTISSGPAATRFDVPNLSGGFSGVTGLSGGGGTGGGGGGASSGGGGGSGLAASDGAIDQLDRLLNGVEGKTPTERVQEWYEEVNTALEEANLQERGMLEEHASYRLDIEQSYQDQLAAIQRAEQTARRQELGSFFGAMADIAEAGGAKLAKVAATYSGAQTLIAAYETAQKAAAEAVTIPGRIAAYSAFLAKGLQTVAAIKKAGDNPSSASSSSSTGGDVTPTATATTTERRIAEFNVTGSGITGGAQLVDAINEAQQQGYQIDLRYSGA